MKMVKSSTHKSWIDIVLGRQGGKKDLTSKEERSVAEKTAVEHEQGRKAQASKYPNVAVSAEKHPGFRDEVSDELRITEAASKELIERLSELSGVRVASQKRLAGVDSKLEEFRSLTNHRDTVDNSIVTDKAIIAFDVKFTQPGLNKYKIAKFVVSYDVNADDKIKVEDKFYDENLKEFEFTSASLEGYLTENTAVKANKEKMLVWFDPEEDTYQEVNVAGSSSKMAARLSSVGFSIEENKWVDACFDPKKFGRLCTRVDVPMERTAEFKKICAMGDEEWVNRALDGKKDGYKTGEQWVDRTTDKSGYKKEDTKSQDKWVARTDEKGPENPYKNEGAALMDDTVGNSVVFSSRKDSVEKAVKEEKKEAKKTIAEQIDDLDKLLNS